MADSDSTADQVAVATARHRAWRERLSEERKVKLKAYKKQWAERNKERTRAQLEARKTPEYKESQRQYFRARYLRLRNEILARAKERYWRDPEAHLVRYRKGPRPKVDPAKQRAARNAWEREDRRRNPERANARSRRYYERHPERKAVSSNRRRARKKNVRNDLTAQQWRDILITFNHCCAYCATSGVRLEQEHMTPIVRGGGHTVSNVVPACVSCNRRKHTKTLLEFAMAA